MSGRNVKTEFDKLKKDWKVIYQWPACAQIEYIEEVSELLLKNFGDITWSADGLRTNEFRRPQHDGSCDFKPTTSPVIKLLEKRFCRALFNEKQIPCFSNTYEREIPFLGTMIDYEVPLTQPGQNKAHSGQKTVKQSQGDIDLLSVNGNNLFLIEVKKPAPSDGLLKAILEIFVYTFRLFKFNMIDNFKEEYETHLKLKFRSVIPAVLTFSDSPSGKNILEITKYPTLRELIKKINKVLSQYKIQNIQFFVVEDFTKDLDAALKLIDGKIFLAGAPSIQQYILDKDSREFENAIDACLHVKKIEVLLNSYFTLFKKEAIGYVIHHITAFFSKINEYLTSGKKSDLEYKNFMDWQLNKVCPFIEAYRNIALRHNCQELLDLNLMLMNPNANNIMVPIVSCFTEEKVLVKLIEAYGQIPVKKSHDYDGVSSHEIDLKQEFLISSALCKFNDKRVIPILKASLLRSNAGKENVLERLLKDISEEEIINFVKPYAESTNFLIRGLTTDCENAEWVLNYLNRNVSG